MNRSQARHPPFLVAGFALVAVVLCLCATSTAQSRSPEPGVATPERDERADPAPVSEPVTAGYRLGSNDLIEIRVIEVPQLNVERRVGETGAIDLPLLGELQVRGLTQGEVADELQRVLEERFVRRATVSAQIREFRSRPISILGAVRQPGQLAFPGTWTLLEVITQVGGLAPTAGDVIHVLRRAENGLTDQITIPVEDLMVRADPRVNIPIFANDLIQVPPAVDVDISLLGEISRPGTVTFKSTERPTLLTAIARAGGLTNRASNRITVRRRGGDGDEEIQVSYRRILNGRDPDIELQAGDIIIVRESFF